MSRATMTHELSTRISTPATRPSLQEFPNTPPGYPEAVERCPDVSSSAPGHVGADDLGTGAQEPAVAPGGGFQRSGGGRIQASPQLDLERDRALRKDAAPSAQDLPVMEHRMHRRSRQQNRRAHRALDHVATLAVGDCDLVVHVHEVE